MTIAQSMASSGQTLASTALKALARRAQGMTGADIERWVREARQSARRDRRPLSYTDLETQLGGTRPSRSTALRLRIATHEAGHAVARMLVGFGPIAEITVDAKAGGGFVIGSTGQDEMTESWLTAVLVETLAGRAAEEIMLETFSANSGGVDHSDLASATKLAVEMETILGLGGRWPLIYRKATDIAATLAANPELAARVNERLERAYQAACTIVREQTDAIDFLAEQLFDAGTLDGPELDAVLTETRKRIRERPG
ncbi:ATP-dependent Zn protease [Mesorhizobium sp. SP-1A]|uniref:ATP-dependent Zn protease n=1 Tax=Mesorhizobium sp. SP-1A TaxID=3077840 RepID=UPI0028F71C99|nr:ATP-dependent Zn protease [Mesorhizobium sp. SP-1A]